MRQFIFLIAFIVVVIAADSSEEKKDGEGSSYTTKVPVESVAVAKKKTGEDKVKIATATKLVEKNVEGSPSEANLPTISIPETTTKSIKLVKVPTEEIAVAHSKVGEETKIATATKASIVAIEEEGKKEEARVRRDADSKESSEDLKKAAVEELKHGDMMQAHGPSESDMAAGDPVKLEAKPESRARRFA